VRADAGLLALEARPLWLERCVAAGKEFVAGIALKAPFSCRRTGPLSPRGLRPDAELTAQFLDLAVSFVSFDDRAAGGASVYTSFVGNAQAYAAARRRTVG